MFHLRVSAYVYQDLNIIIPMRRLRHKELNNIYYLEHLVTLFRNTNFLINQVLLYPKRRWRGWNYAWNCMHSHFTGHSCKVVILCPFSISSHLRSDLCSLSSPSPATASEFLTRNSQARTEVKICTALSSVHLSKYLLLICIIYTGISKISPSQEPESYCARLGKRTAR